MEDADNIQSVKVSVSSHQPKATKTRGLETVYIRVIRALKISIPCNPVKLLERSEKSVVSKYYFLDL